jgi:hypothetical protein
MFTVDSPVTQIVDTAVNRASANGVTRPSADAAGSENSAVNSRISARKMPTANRDGEAVVASRRRSRVTSSELRRAPCTGTRGVARHGPPL